MSRIEHAALQDAIRRALDRLSAVAGEDGWRDFRTLAGESGVWVSAFVVARIAPVAGRRAAVTRARRAIAAAQHPDGGWSFGGAVPPDADSTAWALQALERTRLLTPARRHDAGAFLEGRRVGDGYATYAPDGAIDAFIGAQGRSVAGWTSEHPDVTAAVLITGPPGVTERDALIRLSELVGRQTAAGWWPAYWWRSSPYTAALLVRALARRGRSLPAAREALLLEALASDQLADGGYPLGGAHDADPFTTALAVEALSLLNADEARDVADRAIGALLATQLSDGGWDGDFQLRIPPPDVLSPRQVPTWRRGGGGGGSFVLDRDGVFATAQACAALASYLAPPPTLEPLPASRRRHAEDVVEVFAT